MMTCHSLRLADGRNWLLTSGDEAADELVDHLAGIMHLRQETLLEDFSPEQTRRIVLTVDERPGAIRLSMPAAIKAVRQGESAHVGLGLARANNDLLISQWMHLTTLFGAEAQPRGGGLVHAALAARPCENGEIGILLAAPGGTGKTTASNRLPSPWVSLCDDTTLVVRDQAGRYWAHPWPTWSRFLWGQKGGDWNTQKAVPLHAVFFLEQAPLEKAVPLGPGHAAASLVLSIKQASIMMTFGAGKMLARTLGLEWFEVASSLARSLPSYHLQLSLTGPFWQEVERCLELEVT